MRRWREPAAVAAEIDRIRSLRLDALRRQWPDLGSLALREHFLPHLWGRLFCFPQFDYLRCHSVLLTGVRCLYLVTAQRERHAAFKCNWRRVVDYPNLLRDLYQVSGIAETVPAGTRH